MKAMNGRDIPVTFRWETPWRPVEIEELQSNLGLRPGRTRDINIVTGYVIAQAIVTYRTDPSLLISYSRRMAWYAEPGRQKYFPVHTPYASITAAIDQLGYLGLLDHYKSPPGNLGQQSRFRGNATLWQAYNKKPTQLICAPRERIILRDANGELAPYENSQLIDRWRKQILAFNETLTDIRIELDGKLIREGDAVWILDEDGDEPRMANGTATLSLHRIWNQNWRRNGRLYGCWVQNLPKQTRCALLLNGEPVAEPDYSELHCRLVYDRAGKIMPERPFAIDGWTRPTVKRGFYTMLNAESMDSARHAIAKQLHGPGANDLMQAIKAKHSTVADRLCLGLGAHLMFTDAKIMCRNLAALNRAGIRALPIHDSLVVPAKNEGLAMEIMEQNLATELGPKTGQKSSLVEPKKLTSHVSEIMRETIESLPHNGENGGGGGGAGVAVGSVVSLGIAVRVEVERAVSDRIALGGCRVWIKEIRPPAISACPDDNLDDFPIAARMTGFASWR
jgi:hypothetical protein